MLSALCDPWVERAIAKYSLVPIGACAMEGRHFIGVELDAGYFDIARKRIESVQPALMEAAD